jgi:hypothetical protein
LTQSKSFQELIQIDQRIVIHVHHATVVQHLVNIAIR